MPLRTPIFFYGGYYHIYNRGHNKQNIFLNRQDYIRYTHRLNKYLKKHSISLLAYCLMPNHIHLLIRQEDEEPVDRFIHRLHTSYTKYFNIKYDRIGAVFQGRFKAKLVESDEYLLHVSRYIHLNPLEILHAQRRALRLEEYPWSSYKDYVNGNTHPLYSLNIIQGYFNEKKTYKNFVEEWMKKGDVQILKDVSKGIIPDLLDSESSSLLNAGR